MERIFFDLYLGKICLSNQTNIMSYFIFTHPEDRRLGLFPTLHVERGKSIERCDGVSQDFDQNDLQHYSILLT